MNPVSYYSPLPLEALHPPSHPAPVSFHLEFEITISLKKKKKLQTYYIPSYSGCEDF